MNPFLKTGLTHNKSRKTVLPFNCANFALVLLVFFTIRETIKLAEVFLYFVATAGSVVGHSVQDLQLIHRHFLQMTQHLDNHQSQLSETMQINKQ